MALVSLMAEFTRGLFQNVKQAFNIVLQLIHRGGVYRVRILLVVVQDDKTL